MRKQWLILAILLISVVNCARQEVVVTYHPVQDEDGTLYAEREAEE